MLRGASNRPLWLLAFIPVYVHTHTHRGTHTYIPLAGVAPCTCTHTRACPQFSNVRVDIHDRGAGEGCQLILVQDAIPSKCVEAVDRCPGRGFPLFFPFSPCLSVFPLSFSLPPGLSVFLRAESPRG